MIELLIAPLRMLVDALGTGVLPPNNPVSTLHSDTAALDSARHRSEAAVREVLPSWHGVGADAMSTAAARTGASLETITTDGREIAAVVEAGAADVARAAGELDVVLDSFVRAASSLGPSAFTPAGFTALIPVAIEHVVRAAAIVERTQAELASHTERLASLARHQAPAFVSDLSTTDLSVIPARLRSGFASHPDGGVPVVLPDGSVAYAPDQRAATAVRAALSQQGVPYAWGGTTPAGFDCSGLTQWAYRQAGLELPRLAQDQDTAGFRVSQAELRPGDLAVWSGHVAMYIGNNQFVEAGDPVQVSPLRTTNLDHVFEGFYRPH